MVHPIFAGLTARGPFYQRGTLSGFSRSTYAVDQSCSGGRRNRPSGNTLVRAVSGSVTTTGTASRAASVSAGRRGCTNPYYSRRN